MSYSRVQLRAIGAQVGRSWRTLLYWAAQGCDLNDPESLKRFVEAKNLRKSNARKAEERRKIGRKPYAGGAKSVKNPVTGNGNGDLGEPRRRGAAAALERLEKQEEESHRRLEWAQRHGDQFQVQSAQEYWLKCSETLRRLDLAVEVARRTEEVQIPLKRAQEVTTFVAEWLRIAFVQFLSSEAMSLMAITDVGEWKFYAMERFKGILDLTVINAGKTNSAIPDWANERIKTAWNVELQDATK